MLCLDLTVCSGSGKGLACGCVVPGQSGKSSRGATRVPGRLTTGEITGHHRQELDESLINGSE